jgi:hypothetical protein
MSTTTITNLPNEIILEIAKNLSPKDYVALSKTCHDMRAVLKMDMEKKRKEYEREEFQELAREYMKLKLTERSEIISVFGFYYFSENNDYCYDGITQSYKYYYEKSGKKLTFETYKKHMVMYASYNLQNRVFIKMDFMLGIIQQASALLLSPEEIRKKAYMKFTYSMLLAFLQENEETLRKFLRKPDKPRKRLTNYATEYFNTAKKYWRLREK